MTLKQWEKKILAEPDAKERVDEIENELRLAAGLTALRQRAGLSQRDLAQRMGVTQPRIAAIESSRNVTLDVLDQYVTAVGARLEIRAIKGDQAIALLSSEPRPVGRKMRTKRSSPRRTAPGGLPGPASES